MKNNKFNFERDFVFQNGVVSLTESGKRKATRPKKITGGRIAAVLGKNNFSSPFQAWCDILGLYKAQVDNFYVEAGSVLESQIRDFVMGKLGKIFKSYDVFKERFNVFRDHPLEIFGGIPDGEELNEDGGVVSILEIKTAAVDRYQSVWEGNDVSVYFDENGQPVVISKGGGYSKWFDKENKLLIPESYQLQLSLYLFLRQVTRGYFCVVFLNTEDYMNPRKTVISDKFSFCVEEVNLDLHAFEKYVKQCQEWYQKHIEGRVSPELTPKDLAWFKNEFSECDWEL